MRIVKSNQFKVILPTRVILFARELLPTFNDVNYFSETMKHSRAKMMGAPEVVCLNAALIKMTHAKKVIDIGVFTGASSLAAALALPSGDN